MLLERSIQSAAPLLAFLEEKNPALQVKALQELVKVVDSFWFEISDYVSTIERMYESEAFEGRKVAALLASKVYLRLEDYGMSVKFALGAGDLFLNDSDTEYKDFIIGKCIDFYKQRSQQSYGKHQHDRDDIDLENLKSVVDAVFAKTLSMKQFRKAVGTALDMRRIDMLQTAIKQTSNKAELLNFSLHAVMSLFPHRQFRNEVLKCLVTEYSLLAEPDYINMCQCLIYLENPVAVAEILENLASGSTDKVLVAYQIAFDLYESATQQYTNKIVTHLGSRAPVIISPSAATIPSSSTTAPPSTSTAEKMDVDESSAESTAATVPVEVETPQPPKRKREDLTEEQLQLQERLERLIGVLNGSQSIQLHMQFLIKNNHTDMLILKSIKDAVRNSINYSSTLFANGFMHAGTTCDDFLRDNLEWVSKATNWAKFSAVSSLGVIHKGHESDAMKLLDSYLPKDVGSSGYMEGGALYAMGLIHGNHGTPTAINYLKTQVEKATAENIRHGACLGLGLAAMGSHRDDVYEALKQVLYMDDAVSGEAAGLAMGLVMLGSNSESAIHDMLSYAQDTQHEKILRGLSVGIALVMYARLEEADPLIESLLRDKEPNLRRSGVYTIAMAYCGSGNSMIVKKLRDISISDVNDDVKRAAVTSLGFILFRTPEECPEMVSLLSGSYNPHVRYGAALAVGIACAGSASKDAIELLKPMLKDSVNFVRHGALMSLGLVLMQHNESTCPYVKEFRSNLTEVITDKTEDVIVKFGAIVGQGILDAGGRNVTISLLGRHGHTHMAGVVGVLVFLQYWFWFPLTHFLSLAFTPSCLIGLNSDLKMPKVEFRSGAKPSQFAYPPPMEEKKEKNTGKLESAVLSITAKQKKKDKLKAEGESVDKMDVDDQKEKEEGTSAETPKEEAEKPKEEVKEEPLFQMLTNPARTMRTQLPKMSLPDGRFKPVKSVTCGGIVLMVDQDIEKPVELVEESKAGGRPEVENEKEPEPPEPFMFVE